MSASPIDISERKESERALLSARNYLRAVTDSIGEGLFTQDAEGRVTYLNQVAEDLLGWSRAELRGQVMHGVTHHRRTDGSPLAIEDCPILRAVRDGEVVRVADDIFIRRDGRELPVAYTAAPFATDDGIEGCVVVFEDITDRKAAARAVERDLEKLAWVDRIQAALAEDRFVLYAQPIIDLHSEVVVQCELLLRMRSAQDADRLIAPGAFLAVAEEYGLITEIDRWVIDRGAELAAAGQAVQINVSARTISDPSLADYIAHTIGRTDADPTRLVFEITETTLVSDEAAAQAFVERLHDPRVPGRAGRFRHRVRRVHLSQTASDRLSQDRYRVRPRSPRERGQPPCRAGDRQSRPRIRPEDRWGRHRRSRNAGPSSRTGCRLRPGLSYRTSLPAEDQPTSRCVKRSADETNTRRIAYAQAART